MLSGPMAIDALGEDPTLPRESAIRGIAFTSQGVSMSHKFKVRQRVRLSRPGFVDGKTGDGTYEIVRLLPADQTGEPAYRVKSGMNERAVRESEIAAL